MCTLQCAHEAGFAEPSCKRCIASSGQAAVGHTCRLAELCHVSVYERSASCVIVAMLPTCLISSHRGVYMAHECSVGVESASFSCELAASGRCDLCGAASGLAQSCSVCLASQAWPSSASDGTARLDSRAPVSGAAVGIHWSRAELCLKRALSNQKVRKANPS